jgi:GT2 family glycosyltransferase
VTTIRLERPTGPEVSVIVLGYRRADALARCMASLAMQQGGVPFEVVIVLNGATPDVSRVALDGVEGIVVVRSPVNLGYASACNRGAAAASAPWLALLNDDAVADSGWLAALVRAGEARPKAAAIGPLVLHPDGSVQETGGGRVLPDGSFEALGDGVPRDSDRVTRPMQVDYVTGAGSLLRREAWDEVGGMDETFFPAYFEDIDLGLRLARAGWESWYEPSAVVRHERGASTVDPVRPFVWGSNRSRFLARWGPGGDPDALVEDPATDPGGRPADVEVTVEPRQAARAAAFDASVVDILNREVTAAREAAEREKAGNAWLHEELERERAHSRWLLELLERERARPPAGRLPRALRRLLPTARPEDAAPDAVPSGDHTKSEPESEPDRGAAT